MTFLFLSNFTFKLVSIFSLLFDFLFVKYIVTEVSLHLHYSKYHD